MQVSLAPRLSPSPSGSVADTGTPLLDRRGARVALGRQADAPARPLAPSATTLFGPRGACLAARGGPLLVCDTGHHRLLVWSRCPERDAAPADLVIGQPDLSREGRNANGAVGAATLNVPTGIAVENGVLAVADAWNHRVLLWHGLPARANQPADVVLGQADFSAAAPNRGGAPGADTLNWCFGVHLHEGRLYVTDAGNRRVLVWDRIPTRHGAPADLALGQPDFAARDDNAGGRDDAVGMRWPHAVSVADGRLLVADAGKSRIMVWDAIPGRAGAPCDRVLGQADMRGADANHGAAAPCRGSLSQPYGMALLGDNVVTADTANSRLVGWTREALRAGALAGQPSFDRRDERSGRDGLSWPFGVSACGDTLVVADTGNNRVLLWGAA